MVVVAPGSGNRFHPQNIILTARNVGHDQGIVRLGPGLEHRAAKFGHTTATAMSSPWPTLLLAPLHELAKQSLAFGLALRRTGSGAIQESLEIAADVSLGRCRRAVETREHLLGDGVAIPARNRGA